MNVDKIMNNLEKKHPGEMEYLQAVREVLESIEEVYNQESFTIMNTPLIIKIPILNHQISLKG